MIKITQMKNHALVTSAIVHVYFTIYTKFLIYKHLWMVHGLVCHWSKLSL